VADFFEQAVAVYPKPKTVANWIQTEVFRLLKEHEVGLEQVPFRPEHLVEVLQMVDEGVLSAALGKEVLEASFTSGALPRRIVEERGLAMISEEETLRQAVREAIAGNPKAVADYRAGKTAALGFLMGQVMKLTRGKANPDVVRSLLQEELAASP
jgi:aspartyl-tRNA(Asn)/glutamyl-tRNA(Gln) amidotransferase subunit B